LKISGTAVLNGRDTVVFTAGTTAYSATGNDSMVDLATAWQQSEFNIVGDGRLDSGSDLRCGFRHHRRIQQFEFSWDLQGHERRATPYRIHRGELRNPETRS